MTSFLSILGVMLVGVWVVETVLFVLTYRSSTRAETARAARPLL
jgi:hypothetical protein